MANPVEQDPEPSGGSIADRVYDQVRSMAIGYAIKPGERLNEGELARQLASAGRRCARRSIASTPKG